MSDRRRMSLEFRDDAMRKLDELREETNARSNGEVVRNALRVYEWLLRQQDDGFAIRLTNGKVTKELDL